MPKPKIIRVWIELSETFLEPGKNDDEAILFVNHCELCETKKGLLLIRHTGIESIRASDEDEMADKIAAFAMREDVRRLVKGIDANDFRTLPSEELNPEQDVIDGTADIYQVAEEPTAA